MPSEELPGTGPLSGMPLRLGSDTEFASARDFLQRAGFDESAVTAALKIPTISRLRDSDPECIDRAAVPPQLLTTIDVFIGGYGVPSARLRAACGDPAFATLHALDLIRAVEGQDGFVFCPVWLYPVNGFLIASDRQTSPKGDTDLPVEDAVFPGHDAGTLRLSRLLPATADHTLDLCGGCGIAALQFARNGIRAASADITPRSAHFAAFNARLNGLEIESVCGDLFEPVAGRMFDVITAHPPWMPSTGDGMIFRDGGETGETILQRIIAGLPAHLPAGGTAILLSLGRDGSDASFQQRIRAWLGEAGRDCDVILGVDKILSIDDVVNSMRQLQLRDDPEMADRLAIRFRELGTRQFLHSAIFIRRTGAPVTEPPLRLTMSADATAVDFERIFAWRGLRRSAGFADWLAVAIPRPAANLELNIRHIVRDGAMTEDSAAFTARGALSAAVRPDVWAARLVTQFDGRQSVAAVFDAARREGRMPDDFTMQPFADLVGRMVEWGILEIDARSDGAISRSEFEPRGASA